MTRTPYIVLVTGANRGIGHAISAQYLNRPNHTVIACIRDPDSSTTLTSLPKHPTSALILSLVDSADHSTPSAAVSRLQAQGITQIDLVIANAGICRCFPTAAEVHLSDVRDHFEINVLGPLALFQATLPLLKAASEQRGIFIAISSIGASISNMEKVKVPSAAYGLSKAALNYITRKMHFENDDLCAFLIEPGWVKTDMGNDAAKLRGLVEAEIEVGECVRGIMGVIDGAGRNPKAYSGRFMSYTGGEYPW